MQWGYYKHPPLQAWLLQFVTHIFGHSGYGYFGLSALTTGIAIWAIYKTARLFTTRTKALLAALLCEGILYFNFLSPEFNPNVLQLMTWALCSYAFSNAILRGKLKYLLLSGFFFALGCYAKYSIALLGLGFILFVFTHKDTRRVLGTAAPYLSLLIYAAILSPHILWLFEHDFLPFTYALSRSEAAKDISERLFFPLKFTGAQLLDMAPMLTLCLTLFDHRLPAQPTTGLKNRLLAFLAFAPLGLNAVISLITGHKALDMWGMPYLSFIPLWILVHAPIDVCEKKMRAFGLAWGCCFVLPLLAFYISVVYGTSMGFKPLRGHFPGSALSQFIHQKWNEQVGKTGIPLTTIISDSWIGGNIALYSPDINNRPHVFIDGNSTISPWINPKELRNNGAVVVWRDHDTRPAYLTDLTVSVGTIELPWQTRSNVSPTRIYWAIIKPENDDNQDIASP